MRNSAWLPQAHHLIAWRGRSERCGHAGMAQIQAPDQFHEALLKCLVFNDKRKAGRARNWL
jgi:hypothetical protein